MGVKSEPDVHKPCAFVVEIRPPLSTLQRISELLAGKSVKLETMQLLVLVNGNGRLTINCALEQDRTAYVGRCLEKIPGVLTVDWMNLRTRAKRY